MPAATHDARPANREVKRFYALRYLPEVPLRQRKHEPTLGAFESWDSAETARLERHRGDLLEVVAREVPSPSIDEARKRIFYKELR